MESTAGREAVSGASKLELVWSGKRVWVGTPESGSGGPSNCSVGGALRDRLVQRARGLLWLVIELYICRAPMVSTS